MQVSFWTTTAIVTAVAIAICVLTCLYSVGSFLIGLHTHLQATDDDEEKPLIDNSPQRNRDKEMTTSPRQEREDRDDEARERRRRERKEKKRKERREPFSNDDRGDSLERGENVNDDRGRDVDRRRNDKTSLDNQMERGGGSLEPAARDTDDERRIEKSSEKKKRRERKDKDRKEKVEAPCT